jgi:hypothetical protein
MKSQITFKVQNHFRYASSVACPYAVVEGNDVLLSYDEDAPAALQFVDVACYRVGSPNDEGFFGGGNPGIFNDSMFCWRDFPKLSPDGLYEVSGFDWSNGLVGSEIFELVDRELWPSLGLLHYVYFMKDGTFECLCKSWLEYGQSA